MENPGLLGFVPSPNKVPFATRAAICALDGSSELNLVSDPIALHNEPAEM